MKAKELNDIFITLVENNNINYKLIKFDRFLDSDFYHYCLPNGFDNESNLINIRLSNTSDIDQGIEIWGYGIDDDTQTTTIDTLILELTNQINNMYKFKYISKTFGTTGAFYVPLIDNSIEETIKSLEKSHFGTKIIRVNNYYHSIDIKLN